MMKKRVWALLLAVMMVVSVLPTGVFADESVETPSSTVTDSPQNSNGNGVYLNKSLADNKDGTYKVTLESYVTGAVQTTTTSDPMDIVLVLDVSGSMADDISIVTGYEYKKYQSGSLISFPKTSLWSDWKNGGTEYYYSEDGENYYPITNIVYDNGTWTYTYDKGNGESGSYNLGTFDSIDRIYKLVAKQTTQSKLEALQDAVCAFIGEAQSKNESNRISIVKFAGDKSENIGNDMYTDGGNYGGSYSYTYNNTQIVKNLTAMNTDGAKELTDAVKGLAAAGATAADYGMEFATKVLNGRTGDDAKRKSVVIFFTDGEPNHGNGFDTSVANTAISVAKTLKTGGTTIYAVGVMEGADPTNTTSNINKFMHAVSSNYPSAESMNKMGDRAAGSNYYKTATNADDLKTIFTGIAQSIITSSVAADETTVLTDTVSEYFTPVEGQTVTATVYEAGGTGTEPDLTVTDETYSGTLTGKTLSVTGFDYQANPVVQKDGTWSGKKLVVSFDVKPNTSYNDWTAGTNYYPTNVASTDENATDNAALKEGDTTFAQLTDSPKAAVTAYTVKYQVTSTDNPSTYTGTIPADRVYLAGSSVTVADELSADGYTFSGWKNDTADAENINAITADVIFTGAWTKNPATPVEFNPNNPTDAEEGSEQPLVKKSFTVTDGSAALPGNFSETFEAKITPVDPEEGDNFQKYDGDAITGTVDMTKADEASFNFTGKLTFSAAGTYKFSITEKKGETTGVTYDGDTYTLIVKVELDDETNACKVTRWTVGEDATFVTFSNTYFVQPAPTYTVTYTDGVADEVVFEDQVYSGLAAGTTTPEFKVDGVAANPTRDGYTFTDWSPAVADTVTETVTYIAQWEKKDPDPITVDLNGENDMGLIFKEFTKDNGVTDTAEREFTVKVTENLPEGSDKTAAVYTGKVTLTPGADKTKFTFTNSMLTFTAAGTYTYTVKEVAGQPNDGVTYDDSEYTMTVAVVESAGQLTSSVSFAKNPKEGDIVIGGTAEINPLSTVTFTNHLPYVAPQVAELSVNKEVLNILNTENSTVSGTDVAAAGDTVRWGITVTNSGTAEGTYTLTDTLTLTKGEASVSRTATIFTATKTAEGVWSKGAEATSLENQTLAADATVYYIAEYTVTDDDVNTCGGYSIHNAASINGGTPADPKKDPTIVPTPATFDPNNPSGETEEAAKYALVSKKFTVRTDSAALPKTFKATFEATITPVDPEEGENFLPYSGDPITGTVDMNEADEASFNFTDKLTFSAAGCYVFTAAETKGNTTGVTYDGDTYILTIYVDLDNDETAYKVWSWSVVKDVEEMEPAENGTVTFSNIYYVKPNTITPVGPSVTPKLNKEDHYAYIVGMPDGLVHPEQNITRAEVATIFFRMLLDESRDYWWCQTNSFSDVEEDAWYNNAISTLTNAGLLNGYPDGTFGPNDNITRAEFAAIAVRFFTEEAENVKITEDAFPDIAESWANYEINLAYALDLVQGTGEGTFEPGRQITRAEAMTIVNRVLKRAPEKDHLLDDMIEWPDNMNTRAWYYADVQEATNSHEYYMTKDKNGKEYEIWTELKEVRDWVALEKEWSNAHSSGNPGEVVSKGTETPEPDKGGKLTVD